jgi:hypothetical protein
MTLDEYAICEVEEERSNEGRVKLNGGKRDEIVNGSTIVFYVSVFE